MKAKKLLTPVVAGLIIGAVAWLGGLATAESVVLGVIVAVAVLAASLVVVDQAAATPTARRQPSSAPAWFELGRTESAIRQAGQREEAYTSALAPRLRAVAQRRLARRGVDLADVRQGGIVGRALGGLLDDASRARFRGVTAEDRQRAVAAHVERVLDELDELERTWDT